MTKASNVNKSTLDSGIRVVTESIPHVHSVSLGVWVLAATCDESPRNNGIAHFLEHMVFKGTHSRSSLELADSLESLGGHLNAFTGKEHTCFYAQVLSEHIDVAIEVLADMILNSRMSDGDIETEKDVVLEEITELNDNPGDLVHEYFVQSLYKPHPLSYSILGNKDSVRQISRDDLLEFLQRNYAGNRVVIAAAGNVEHERVVELTARYFAAIPASSTRLEFSLSGEVPTHDVFENNFQQAHLCLGRRAFSYSDQRRHALLLLNTILGAGMSSRLFQNIREKHGLAYSIYSFVDFFMDTGMFGIYLGTDREKLDLAIELVKKELNNLSQKPVPEDELLKRKNQMKGNLLLGMESTSNRMDRLARMETYYEEFKPIEATIRSIESVNQEQILEIAAGLFREAELYSTILRPADHIANLHMKAG
jgi:predicted Zn-dependent peptidase